jgi:hypothetical protein
MTYLADEQAGLDPIELYEFTYADQTWRYTDADVDYLHPVTGDLFAVEPIHRDSLKQSEESNSMSVDVTIDALNPVADFFRAPFLPARQVWLVIYRTHRGAVGAPAVTFRGQVGQVEFTGASAKLTCVPMRHAINRVVPVQLVQRLCSNTVYDGRCKADPALFSITRTITSLDGLTVGLSAGTGHAAGFFSGGYIEAAGIPPATIKEDLVNTVKLLYNSGYAIGTIITIIAGCDRKLETCMQKFQNEAHYQGFPMMPVLDPFADEIA